MSKEIGFVAGIFISPPTPEAQKLQGGFPIVRIAEAELIEGHGIMSRDGRLDRYFAPNGAKYAGAYPPNIVRQLSVIHLDAITRANQGMTHEFTMAHTRRNIVIGGIDISAEDLNEILQMNLRIGDAGICGTSLCDPCDRPSKLSGIKGFKQRFTNEAGASLGGIRTEITKSGIIKVGQTVYLE